MVKTKLKYEIIMFRLHKFSMLYLPDSAIIGNEVHQTI